MRKYKNYKKKELVQVCCNGCGRELKIENGIIIEGVYTDTTVWGYFSNKDGQRHSFDLCETCYDRWIQTFKIPITIQTEKELF